MLCPKSAILGLSFLDSKDLCLPNQFSRGYWQKHSVSTYLTWCQRRNWVASMIELTLIFNPSYVFRPAIWTFSDQHLFQNFLYVSEQNFSQSWNNLRKTLRNHENLWSLTDLSDANIGFHSNSRDWLIWVFMLSKINPLMNKSGLFW